MKLIYKGTAALGCPAEQSSAPVSIEALQTGPWARRTAEGGCPHMISQLSSRNSLRLPRNGGAPRDQGRRLGFGVREIFDSAMV